MRGAVERVLQRDSDQRFHLLGGHAWAFGLNLHIRRRELGKDIHRQAEKLLGAQEHHHRGGSNHQEAKV